MGLSHVKTDEMHALFLLFIFCAGDVSVLGELRCPPCSFNVISTAASELFHRFTVRRAFIVHSLFAL